MTATEAKEQYGDLRTFRADIDILIDRGFIKQTFSGAPFMKANKYGFSDKWKLITFLFLKKIKDIRKRDNKIVRVW